MPWIELHATTSAEYAEELSYQLTLLGAQAVTFEDAGDQPIYEPKQDTPRVWQETIVIALFDYEQATTPIKNYLEKQQTEGLLRHFRIKEIGDEDWVRRSLEQFKPMRFGQRLWICPSWHQPPDPTAVNVILDPGLAFGTGTHPTTALCLEWLDAHIDAQSLAIDYGCGSGILAVAALKLGAKQVIAIDNDEQALEATLKNGAQNQLYPPALTVSLPEESAKYAADLVIANILAQPLIELAPRLASYTKPHGKIILSGILAEQVPDIIHTYQTWFEMAAPVTREGWVCVAGVKHLPSF